MPNNGESGTVVGANVKLQGTINDSNDIIVHGQVDGEVKSEKSVTITESAKVKGPVKAEQVIVAGTVNGEVEASVKLELQPSGTINGSVSTRDLSIASGAQFNGKSKMLGTEDSDGETDDQEENETEDQETTPEGKNAKNEEDFELE